MHRAFLDANVLFSAAYRETNKLLGLWEYAANGHLVLLSSAYAVEEARRNLDSEAMRSRLNQLTATLELVDAGADVKPPSIEPPLPEKDVPILTAAIAGRATFLVTGDRTHFGSLFDQTVQGVTVVPPSELLRRLAAEKTP